MRIVGVDSRYLWDIFRPDKMGEGVPKSTFTRKTSTATGIRRILFGRTIGIRWAPMEEASYLTCVTSDRYEGRTSAEKGLVFG